MSYNLENRLLLCCQPIEYESLSPGLNVADLFYQPLLESQGVFLTVDCDPGSLFVVVTELASWTSPDS